MIPGPRILAVGLLLCSSLARAEDADPLTELLDASPRPIRARLRGPFGPGPGEALAALLETRTGLALRVIAHTIEDEPPSTRLEVPKLSGRRVAAFRSVELEPGQPQILVMLDTRYPDERHVEVLVASRDRVLHHGTRIVHTGTVASGPFGELREQVGLRRVEDRDELVWITGGASLKLEGASGAVRVPVARHERRLVPSDGQLVWGPTRRVDLAPRRPPSRVSPSRQAVPLYGAPNPTAGMDADLGTAWHFEVSPEPSTAVSERAELIAAVASLSEAEPAPKKAATLTAYWDAPTEVRLIRLIPGCLGGQGSWSSHHVVSEAQLELSTGEVISLLGGPEGSAISARARFSLGEGWQSLTLLDAPRLIRWARLRILNTSRGSPKGETVVPEACVTELGFH